MGLKRRYSGPSYYPRKRMLNTRPGVGFFGNLGAGVAGLASMYMGRKGGYKNSKSGQGITSQYDKTTIYRKKNMSRRKKKVWKQFTRKVRASLMKDVGTRTILRNSSLTALWSTSDQDVKVATLYGKDGNTASAWQCGHSDLREIFANDPLLSKSTDRALFGSAVLDITFTNMSTDVSQNGINNTGMEIDIYDIIYRSATDAADLNSMLTDAALNTETINGGPNEISIATRGATPWELPDCLARGVKILSKKKYFLSKGQVATYQLRDSKNRIFRADIVNDGDNNFVAKGATRSLLIISKGVPTPDPSTVNKQIVIGATRKYSYKIVEQNNDADQLLV